MARALSAYRTILAGYDGDEGGRDALALGQVIARSSGASLTVASAYPGLPDHGAIVPAGELEAEVRRETLASLEAALAPIELPGGVEGRAVWARSPAEALHRVAHEIDADAMVIGSTSRGVLGRLLIGSTGERLLHGSPCPVAVAPRGYAEHDADQVRAIGVAHDGTEEADLALDDAVALATATAAALKVISVVEHPGLPSARPAAGGASVDGGRYDDLLVPWRAGLRRALDEIPDDIAAEGELLAGEPVEELIAAAEEHGLDFLVIGSRGYGPIRTVLLGGVSARLVRTAACPVLVVARGERQPATLDVPVAEVAR